MLLEGLGELKKFGHLGTLTLRPSGFKHSDLNHLRYRVSPTKLYIYIYIYICVCVCVCVCVSDNSKEGRPQQVMAVKGVLI
jgi:hypothetical protein